MEELINAVVAASAEHHRAAKASSEAFTRHQALSEESAKAWTKWQNAKSVLDAEMDRRAMELIKQHEGK